jgi:hypothetical protein
MTPRQGCCQLVFENEIPAIAVEVISQPRVTILGELDAIDAEVTWSRTHGAQMSPSGDIALVLQLETIQSSHAFARLGGFLLS